MRARTTATAAPKVGGIVVAGQPSRIVAGAPSAFDGEQRLFRIAIVHPSEAYVGFFDLIKSVGVEAQAHDHEDDHNKKAQDQCPNRG